jgi:hypothetical protein
MNYVLLTGAGFSRNWGGWLADECFEYLLSCSEITPVIRRELWKSKNQKLGFENTLQELRALSAKHRDDRHCSELSAFEAMLEGMFHTMRIGFERFSSNLRTTYRVWAGRRNRSRFSSAIRRSLHTQSGHAPGAAIQRRKRTASLAGEMVRFRYAGRETTDGEWTALRIAWALHTLRSALCRHTETAAVFQAAWFGQLAPKRREFSVADHGWKQGIRHRYSAVADLVSRRI